MDWQFSPKSLREVCHASAQALRGFWQRSRLPLLLLVYPIFACLLVAVSSLGAPRPPHAQALAGPVIEGALGLIGVGLGFCIVVSLWAARYRARPAHLPPAFIRGLYCTFGLLALILPAQALVLGVALYVAGPEELWVWSLFVLGGAITATAILLNSGLRERPESCDTIRAKLLDLADHPQLAALLREISQTHQVPLPDNILVGLQPELLWRTGTIFCPEAELRGSTIYLSWPLARLLSVAEFSALAGQGLLHLQSCLTERRSELTSTVEGARGVVNNLNASMKDWSWFPKWGLHPVFIALRMVGVAAVRFPLYLGKEFVIFFVNQFLETRQHADITNLLEVHRLSSDNVGKVEVISALMKEAALSLGARWQLWQDGTALHPLGEVILAVREQHPSLLLSQTDDWSWRDPHSAWNHLEMRCNLSRVGLNWCLQMAKEVSPAPNAQSLFTHPTEVEQELIEISRITLVMPKRRGTAANG